MYGHDVHVVDVELWKNLNLEIKFKNFPYRFMKQKCRIQSNGRGHCIQCIQQVWMNRIWTCTW